MNSNFKQHPGVHAPKILYLVNDFVAPWDEGGKNNVKALLQRTPQHWEVCLAGLAERDHTYHYQGFPVYLYSCPFYRTLLRRLFYPSGYLRLLCKLKIILKQERPDLIVDYLESGLSGFLIYLLKTLPGCKIPIVKVLWNDTYHCQSAPWYIMLNEQLSNFLFNHERGLPYALRAFTQVIATSRYLQRKVQSYDIPALYVPTGVDTTLFKPQMRVGEYSRVQVGYLGHITYTKGVSLLIEACRGLMQRGRIRLNLALTQGDETHLLQLRTNTSLNIQRWVMPWNFFNQNDILVFPRRYSYGSVSYPNVVLEAMACAKAVITTRQPGITEVIRHGHNGFLVQPNDSRALLEAIEYLVQHPALRARLGEQARRTMEQQFDWDKIAPHFFQLLLTQM